MKLPVKLRPGQNGSFFAESTVYTNSCRFTAQTLYYKAAHEGCLYTLWSVDKVPPFVSVT